MARAESLSVLAQRVNCKKYPLRWEAFYEEVMDDFDANGCKYLHSKFYEELHQRYGILTQHLDLYKKAARLIAQDEDLSRFLAILCRGLQDRKYHKADMKEFSAPKKHGDFAYEMLTALAIASEAEMCHELLTSRGLPKEYVDQLMKMPEGGIPWFERRNGRPGYCLLDWNQLAIDGKLYRIGRLEIEIDHAFGGKIKVFRNPKGEEVALAHELAVHKDGVALGSKYYEEEEGSCTPVVKETAEYWEGFPVDERGLVKNERIQLPKNEWQLILETGDPTVSLHIPAGGGLSPQTVDETMSEIQEFLRKYYPDYKYKAFVCYSWLMDPQLVDLLGKEANISRFCNRFRKVTMKSDGNAVFRFVFLKPDTNFELTELPETTTLERALKNHYLNGKAIYEICGYFF